MSPKKKPSKSAFEYTSLYEAPPQKDVLLLSCMDIRLLDNTVKFMDELNLQNRYDQVIFAGAGMGAGMLPEGSQADPKTAWLEVFFAHLKAAIELLERDIKDIFILEHLDCGAYKYLHPTPNVRTAYSKYSKAGNFSQMVKYHRNAADDLDQKIAGYCNDMQSKYPTDSNEWDRWEHIKVHKLVMDLTGRVSDL